MYNQPISKLVEFITASYTANPEISIEVFVHKAEKLQEDDKIGKSTTVVFACYTIELVMYLQRIFGKSTNG